MRIVSLDVSHSRQLIQANQRLMYDQSCSLTTPFSELSLNSRPACPIRHLDDILSAIEMLQLYDLLSLYLSQNNHTVLCSAEIS